MSDTPVSAGEWFEASSNEVEAIRLLCRSAILKTGESRVHELILSLDWTRFADIAGRNRLWLLLEAGFRRNGLDFPPQLSRAAAASRELTVLMNSFALTRVRSIALAFDRERIPLIVMKGPLHQFQVYGTYFARLSSDIDLLVPRECFTAASNILLDLDYVLPEKFKTLWWRRYLGEQHFVGRDNPLNVVDLHWKVQQPGCPSPRNIREFFQKAVLHDVGTIPVPTLATSHATLLDSISVAKALLNREPAGAHLAELLAASANASRLQDEEVVSAAKRQGLANTHRLALHAAEVTFGVRLPLRSHYPPVPSAPSAADLPDMLLDPDHAALRWPRRGAYLWGLCDGSASGSKPATFAREFSRSIEADICRRTTTGRAGSSSSGEARQAGKR